MNSTGTEQGRVRLGWAPGAWLQRADGVLARSAAVNAARAVAEERARRRRWASEEDGVLLLPEQHRRR